MGNSMIVSHTHPFFSALVPSGNKKEINVTASERVYTSSERCGGSYSSYHRARLEHPGTGLHVNMGTGFPSFQQGENEVLPGEFFLETGSFQGKPMRPRVILHPTDYARLCIPRCALHEDCRNNPELAAACAAEGPGISERQAKILGAYRMTGNYRKETLTRMGVSAEEVSQLTAMGLLAKKGHGIGLSAEGRNLSKDN